MPAHEFSFTLDLPNEADSGQMLSELAAAVCTHVGLTDATGELAASLRDALAAGAAKGQSRADVAFTAHDGELRLEVRFAGGGEWRTSRPLPAGQA